MYAICESQFWSPQIVAKENLGLKKTKTKAYLYLGTLHENCLALLVCKADILSS